MDGGHRHEDGGCCEHGPLQRQGDRKIRRVALAQPAAQDPSGADAQREGHHRHDRGQDREVAGAGNAEGQQHHVAGHVRRENVTKAEVTDSVHRARREGERKQRQRQRMPEVGRRLFGQGH